MNTLLKYKQNRKLITIKCDNCSIDFEKPISEYTRNLKLNRKNYCSRSCCGKNIKNVLHLKNVNSNYNISQHSLNRKDDFSNFKYYYRNIKRRFKEFNITLNDLKEQWNLQKGICPYTNLQLKLYKYKESHPYELRASLDRIDNTKGYIKGNIEFISLPINYLKADQFTKKETLNFLKNITSNFH